MTLGDDDAWRPLRARVRQRGGTLASADRRGTRRSPGQLPRHHGHQHRAGVGAGDADGKPWSAPRRRDSSPARPRRRRACGAGAEQAAYEDVGDRRHGGDAVPTSTSGAELRQDRRHPRQRLAEVLLGVRVGQPEVPSPYSPNAVPTGGHAGVVQQAIAIRRTCGRRGHVGEGVERTARECARDSGQLVQALDEQSRRRRNSATIVRTGSQCPAARPRRRAARRPPCRTRNSPSAA
jgi:hypothetical protein